MWIGIDKKYKALKSEHDECGVINMDAIDTNKYNTEKGYGFIRQGTKDIFFHISNCKYNDIATGDKILFSTTATDKGLKAIDIIKVTKLK